MCLQPLIINEYEGVTHHEHIKETYFHTSLLRDSLQVQKNHTVNDDEAHEENPHLEDYLIVHVEGHEGAPQNECCTQVATTNNEVPTEKEESCTQEIKRTDKVVHTKTECCTHGFLHMEATSSTAIAVDDEPQENQPKRRVHFGTVLVRDYDIILGDHPCCSYGPPLTIDWDYLEYKPLDVNEYEFHRPPRKSLKKMSLNYYQRKWLLSNAGCSEADFKLSKKQINRVKSNRSLTRLVASNYPLLKMEDAAESACRKFKRLIKQDHREADKSCTASNFDPSIMHFKSLLSHKKVHNTASEKHSHTSLHLHSSVSDIPSYH